MIPGVAASMMMLQGLGGSQATFADFVASQYQVDGVTVAAGDVVDDTGRISASGLSIEFSGNVELIGAFRDKILATDFTIVLEVTLDAATTVTLMSAVSSLTAHFVELFMDSAEAWTWDWAGGDERNLTASGATALGLNRIALTRTADRLAISANGSAAVEDSSTQPGMDLTEVNVAGNQNAGSAGHIRRIDIYAPQDNAVLPSLSAV